MVGLERPESPLQVKVGVVEVTEGTFGGFRKAYFYLLLNCSYHFTVGALFLDYPLKVRDTLAPKSLLINCHLR